MSKQSLKAVLSTVLALLLMFLAATGALLYFGKTGVVWGFSRQSLREIHFWAAVSMCVLIPVHLILNCRLYLAEVRALMKKGKLKSGRSMPEKKNEK